jgi:coenzyme F420-reducing hydrogenase beta subunit
MTLYEHMPNDVRNTVDVLIEELKPEPWPTRFLGLIGWLGEMLQSRTDPDPSLVLQQWSGLVTAFLEHLPPDSSVMECQALMSVSFNDEWRAQAIALIDRDPSVVDRMTTAYPSWGDVVESLLEAAERRPIKKQPLTPS